MAMPMVKEKSNEKGKRSKEKKFVEKVKTYSLQTPLTFFLHPLILLTWSIA
jgi:hypothetical protein